MRSNKILRSDVCPLQMIPTMSKHLSKSDYSPGTPGTKAGIWQETYQILPNHEIMVANAAAGYMGHCPRVRMIQK